jgi:hypothetical protein
MKNIIHAIEMQGHSDDEEEDEAVAPAEMLQEVVPIQQAVAEPPPPPAQQPRQVDGLMQLSVQGLHGMPGEGTLSVQMMIAGKQTMALIYTGSTDTFLDNDFVKASGFQTTPIRPQTVKVAGGGELACTHIVSQCSYKLQNIEFTNDFHVPPLKGYDIILGANCVNASVQISSIGNREVSQYSQKENGLLCMTTK